MEKVTIWFQTAIFFCYRIEIIVWITWLFLCGWILLSVTILLCLKTSLLFGSFVQTMANLRCAYLISLHRRPAKTDRDRASNQYYTILGVFRSWRASKLPQWFKSYSHLIEFDWLVGFMSCLRWPFFYLNNQNGHKCLVQLFFKEKLLIFMV